MRSHHAGVHAPQLHRTLVLLFSAAALVGSSCAKNLPAAPPPALGVGSGGMTDPGTAKLATTVATTTSQILQMVVKDFVGPAAVQQVQPSVSDVPRQVGTAVPLLLLVLKQLSVSAYSSMKDFKL